LAAAAFILVGLLGRPQRVLHAFLADSWFRGVHTQRSFRISLVCTGVLMIVGVLLHFMLLTNEQFQIMFARVVIAIFDRF
jgi:ABC-type transport system involved in cytochrome c biogenesis permease subunit